MTKKLMVVDDNKQILEVISLLLPESDYNITYCSNGLECVEQIKNGYKGLILLDVMMPRLDGWQTIEKLVEQELIQNIVICLMTCVTDPPEEATSLTSHISGYIPKPFTEDQLIEAINNYSR